MRRWNWRCVVWSSCGGAPTWAMPRPGCRSRGEGLVLLRRRKALRLSLRDFGGSRDAFLYFSLSVAWRTNCKELLRNLMASYRRRRCGRLYSSALTLRRHRFQSPVRPPSPLRGTNINPPSRLFHVPTSTPRSQRNNTHPKEPHNQTSTRAQWKRTTTSTTVFRAERHSYWITANGSSVGRLDGPGSPPTHLLAHNHYHPALPRSPRIDRSVSATQRSRWGRPGYMLTQNPRSSST